MYVKFVGYNPKVRTVTMFVTVDLKATFHTESLVMLMMPPYEISYAWLQWFISYRHKSE
jgi:hypothetical protein